MQAKKLPAEIPALLLAVLTTPALGQSIDFVRDVQPILSTKCLLCHGPALQMARLRFDQEQTARRVLLGKDNSELVRRITSSDPRVRMPPWPQGLALQPREVAVLQEWVKQGAPWSPAKLPPPALERLNQAIAANDLPGLRKALQNRALLNARDAQGATPLMHAALEGDLPALRFLLDQGADPNLQDWDGLTALILAVEDTAKVRLLLSRRARPDQKTNEGTTALIAAASFRNSTDTLKVLLDHGADPNAVNSDGATPLLQASSIGHIAAMKLLLERGALVNPKLTGSMQAAG